MNCSHLPANGLLAATHAFARFACSSSSAGGTSSSSISRPCERDRLPSWPSIVRERWSLLLSLRPVRYIHMHQQACQHNGVRRDCLHPERVLRRESQIAYDPGCQGSATLIAIDEKCKAYRKTSNPSSTILPSDIFCMTDGAFGARPIVKDRLLGTLDIWLACFSAPDKLDSDKLDSDKLSSTLISSTLISSARL